MPLLICYMNSKLLLMKNKLTTITYGQNNKNNVLMKLVSEKKKLEMLLLPQKKPKKPQMDVNLKK